MQLCWGSKIVFSYLQFNKFHLIFHYNSDSRVSILIIPNFPSANKNIPNEFVSSFSICHLPLDRGAMQTLWQPFKCLCTPLSAFLWPKETTKSALLPTDRRTVGNFYLPHFIYAAAATKQREVPQKDCLAVIFFFFLVTALRTYLATFKRGFLL